jgi:hypothetical protein
MDTIRRSGISLLRTSSTRSASASASLTLIAGDVSRCIVARRNGPALLVLTSWTPTTPGIPETTRSIREAARSSAASRSVRMEDLPIPYAW